jgi:hypothetical protein
MDVLGFEYSNYEKIEEEVGGMKKKRVVSILKRQAGPLKRIRKGHFQEKDTFKETKGFW